MRSAWIISSLAAAFLAVYYVPLLLDSSPPVLNNTSTELSDTPNSPIQPSRLPPNYRVYAIGDVHGRVDLLRELLDKISADVKNSTADQNVVLFLGDYVDRGDDSKAVLELVLGPVPIPGISEFLPLTGNHERMMLGFLDKPKSRNHAWWLRNGGAQTVASFGLSPDMPATQLASELVGLLGPLLERIRNLPLYYLLGDYLFVHAGVRPDLSLASQEEESLLWIREPFLTWPGPYCGNLTVVHG
jgi:serine/threonine protein phosphatase 1